MNIIELRAFLDRAGVILWDQQWTLIEQQLEIDQLTKLL